ncbi:hypothetical protein ACPB9J_15925 [Streptomyces lavendulocolor]|uniref:hypothetical protein n=1 Tax=Streptomyces lavendulocolor TaxID=67316 RepID=UPI003C2BEEA9
MTSELLPVLSKARIAFIVVGLTSLLGVTPDLITRLAVFVVVLAALVFDSLVDEQRARTKAPPPEYRPAA